MGWRHVPTVAFVLILTAWVTVTIMLGWGWWGWWYGQ